MPGPGTSGSGSGAVPASVPAQPAPGGGAAAAGGSGPGAGRPGGLPPRLLVIGVLLVPFVLALALSVFAWPAARMAPRDLPLGVAGPAADAVAERLAAAVPGGSDAIDIHRYPDAAAARSAIERREVYGAIVADPGGVTVLTASAGSPAVAQMISQAADAATSAGSAAESPAAGPRVVDVVPTPSADPRGGAFTASVLPLLIGGMVAGVVLSTFTRPGVRQAGLILLACVLGGAAAAGIIHSWLGVVPGSWFAVAGVCALMIAAVGTVIAGLRALIGTPGIGVGAIALILFGNAWSGASGAPELLPGAVSVIGSLLPPGAAASLMRGVAFFDGNGIATPLTVLLVWIALGLAAIIVRGARGTRGARAGSAGPRGRSASAPAAA